MTVYVDEWSKSWGRIALTDRMIADTDAELHAMAARISVARGCYMIGYYSIAPSKRAHAVRKGAREITRLQLSKMMRKRRRGAPIETPEIAQAEMDARHNERGA